MTLIVSSQPFCVESEGCSAHVEGCIGRGEVTKAWSGWKLHEVNKGTQCIWRFQCGVCPSAVRIRDSVLGAELSKIAAPPSIGGVKNISLVPGPTGR